MNNPKALFQIDNGAGWQTIAEADIIDGIIPPPPNAWTMVRAMNKQIIYTGYTPMVISIAPEEDESMEHIIKLNRIVPPEKITLDAHDYFTLLSLLTDKIIEHMKSAEEAGLSYDAPQLGGLHYLETLHTKLVPFQIRQRSVKLRLEEEQS